MVGIWIWMIILSILVTFVLFLVIKIDNNIDKLINKKEQEIQEQPKEEVIHEEPKKDDDNQEDENSDNVFTLVDDLLSGKRSMEDNN